jgi:hypothetical protein
MKAPDIKVLKAKRWYHNRDLRMPQEMLRSTAFLSLTQTSMVVLMLFLSRREWRYEGKGRKKIQIFHNTELKFPYSEAKEYGIGEKQFRRCITRLIEHGFLEVVHQGGQLHGHRECSVYDLIDDWKLYGTPQFTPRRVPKGVCPSDSLARYNRAKAARKARGEANENISCVMDDNRTIVTDDN